MGQHVRLFDDGAPVTFTATVDVVGGQLLTVTGPRSVSPTSGSTAAWVGTAAFDAAAGEKVTVLPGGVQRILASGAIAAGARVIPAAAGKVVTIGAGDAAHAVGTALTAGTDVPVEILMDH
ncbi:DUF2190 family protein [Paenarthrobacter sp. PAE-2]|uniref:capsid cement protein n=1 Tax=Paenarthrobacter sp. PAE-2 TaxID=2982532 RepID=UPI00222EDE0D|nr:capsid cement protein [Paenarthrobacter sp. PAE-2]MCW3766463.1 DUF2190 family protein [Paenarthrobacter sp. PAE-2]